MISSKSESGLAELMDGKTIKKVSPTDEVLFANVEGGSKRQVLRDVWIEFTDGTKVHLSASTTEGYYHDGSGGANIYALNQHNPFIKVRK